MNLMVTNVDRKPTFSNARRKTCLDVILSEEIYRVGNSDHMLIKFSLRGNFPKGQPYRNPRKSNWNLFRT